MKLNNWNNFLITENMDKAKSYMKANNISTTDDGFKLLRDLLNKNMGYMYKFTVFYYEENVSIGDLTDLLGFLTSGDSSKLRNSLDSYLSYNDLIDEIDEIRLNKEVKIVFDELTPTQKEFVVKPTGSYDKKFTTLAQEIYKIENKKSFFRKISKAHDYYTLIDLMTDFITKHKVGGSYDGVLNRISDFPNDTEIVYQDQENEIIICKVKRFEASNKLGSTNWCIVNQVSSWESYVYPSGYVNQQYFIWNFNLGISDPNYLCGVTVGKNGINNAHDFNDTSIKSNLPQHIIELQEYLQPVPDDELQEYMEIAIQEKNDKKRLEYIATQERLRHLRDENIERRENDEWGEDNGLIQSVIEFLTDYHDLDLEELKEDNEDIYDVLFLTNGDDDIFTFEFGSIELMAAEYEKTQEYAIERCENLLDEFKENYYNIFGENSWIVDDCIDTDWIIRDYEEDYVEEEDIEWDEFFDEDDIRDNWEDYPEIEADEDGDMDEDSFGRYIETLKDEHREDAEAALLDNRNSELRDDPIEYVKQMSGDGSSLSKYVDEEKLVKKIIDADGYAHNMGSYDGTVEEYTHNGETYCVWRTN